MDPTLFNQPKGVHVDGRGCRLQSRLERIPVDPIRPRPPRRTVLEIEAGQNLRSWKVLQEGPEVIRRVSFEGYTGC